MRKLSYDISVLQGLSHIIFLYKGIFIKRYCFLISVKPSITIILYEDFLGIIVIKIRSETPSEMDDF